eukprot:6465399-Amphidinium_carterae.2
MHVTASGFEVPGQAPVRLPWTDWPQSVWTSCSWCMFLAPDFPSSKLSFHLCLCEASASTTS